MSSPFRCAVLALAVAAGCTADDPVDRPGMIDADVTSDLLPPPQLDGIPERTPNTYVALRGTTEGSRVISLGALGTQLTSVLPGGSFCQDAALSTDGANRLEVYAVGGDGRVSPPVIVDVTYDPSANPPASGSCSGSGGGNCAEAEVCDTQDVDENCDGWADACDLACSGCVDDAYEPNDVAINVASLPAGTYDMVLCPCRDDWFAFHVGAGGRIRASASFTHALIDIDMRLFVVNPDGSGTGAQVDTSVTTSDVESIDFTAPEAGTYFLRIYPFKQDDKPTGTYQLTIQ